MHSWITLRTGLRNSSTGVPMVMITGPLVDMSLRPAGEEQPLVGQRLGEQRLRAILDERHAARLQGGKRLLVEVVDVDGQSLGGKRQHQRNTDMAGAADHGQIGGLGGDRANGGGTVGNVQRLSPNVGLYGRTVA